eukprot:12914424-Alexandrium_andersonii.AAC.1
MCSAGAAAEASRLRGCPSGHRERPHGPRPAAHWRLPLECSLSPWATFAGSWAFLTVGERIDEAST